MLPKKSHDARRDVHLHGLPLVHQHRHLHFCCNTKPQVYHIANPSTCQGENGHLGGRAGPLSVHRGPRLLG